MKPKSVQIPFSLRTHCIMSRSLLIVIAAASLVNAVLAACPEGSVDTGDGFCYRITENIKNVREII